MPQLLGHAVVLAAAAAATASLQGRLCLSAAVPTQLEMRSAQLDLESMVVPPPVLAAASAVAAAQNLQLSTQQLHDRAADCDHQSPLALVALQAQVA